MLKFDEQKQIDNVNGALALRPEIEKVVDEIQQRGFDGIYFIGIGGTWASGMQVEVYMRGRSSIPVYVENGAEFITTGNKRFTKDSIVIFSSVTGSTEEMVKAIEKVRKTGAKVFGFIDKPDAPMVKLCDWCISYPMNEQLKFYMVANRLMFNNGEFPEYDQYNAEMEAYLARAWWRLRRKQTSGQLNLPGINMNISRPVRICPTTLWAAVTSGELLTPMRCATGRNSCGSAPNPSPALNFSMACWRLWMRRLRSLSSSERTSSVPCQSA
uniref:SIS domain-containing protein n=1 Tax=Clostridium sp. NkU-1 TaxID=1095009 RepID=UPI000A763B4F